MGFLSILSRFLGEKEKEVMNYKPGDYFGELALLKDEPRAASIKAKVKIYGSFIGFFDISH